MPIQFCCTQCHQPIEVDDEHAGQSAVCPYCRHVIAVPTESTHQPATAVTARPLGGVPSASGAATAPDVCEPPAEHRRPTIPAQRQRAAFTFGNYALICAGLGLILFAFAMVGGAALFLQHVGPTATTQPTPEEMERHLRSIVAEHAWIPALELGGLFFGLAALALGIVSLTQVPGNWRGLTAVIVCGLFLVCVCSATGLAVAMGVGAGGT